MKLTQEFDSSGGWHVYGGPSSFLVVEGSAYSRPFGRWVYLIAKFVYWFKP